jgi:hypothetical protein
MLVHGLLDLGHNRLLAEVLHGHPFIACHRFELTSNLFRSPDDILAGSKRITPPLAET